MPTAFGLVDAGRSLSHHSTVNNRLDKGYAVSNKNSPTSSSPDTDGLSPGSLVNENPFFSRAKEKKRKKNEPNSPKPKEEIQNLYLDSKNVEFQTCEECGFMTESEERFQAHLKEPRHVNNYRNKAYQEPKKRQIWLKIWFSTLEEAEEVNHWAFEVDETEEDDFAMLMKKEEEEEEKKKKKSSSITTTKTTTITKVKKKVVKKKKKKESS